MSILVVGSVAYDDLETPFGKHERVMGGAAFHFSLSASMFHSVRLVGVVGGDYGDEPIALLKKRNIDLQGLQIKPEGKTFHWKGAYGYDLNEAKTLATDLNVFADFDPKLPASYTDSPFVFLANIDPVLQLHVLEQVQNPKWVACDTMNFWIEGKLKELKETIAKVDILLVNETEVRELTQEHNLVKAAKAIHEMGPKVLVIKRGEYGALLFTQDMIFSVPGYPLRDILDPTGAGDTFAGGFLGYLANQGNLEPMTLKRAAVCGSVMSSFNVEHFGSHRLFDLTQDNVEERYQSFKELSFFDASPFKA